MAIWRRRDGLDGLVHHSDRGGQYLSIRYTERLAEAGGGHLGRLRGDSFDNALAETTIGLYKTELIRRRAPGAGLDDSSWPPWSGWAGTTTAGCTAPSTMSHRSSTKPPMPPAIVSHPCPEWRCHDKPASKKPGAVHHPPSLSPRPALMKPPLSLARSHRGRAEAAHHRKTMDNSGERRLTDRAGQQPFPSVSPGCPTTRIVSRREEVGRVRGDLVTEDPERPPSHGQQWCRVQARCAASRPRMARTEFPAGPGSPGRGSVGGRPRCGSRAACPPGPSG